MVIAVVALATVLAAQFGRAQASAGGTVVAWGYNGAGQTSVLAGLSGVTAIAAGNEHTVALTSDGTVVAWGDNLHGQTSVPAGLSGVTAIAAGGGYTVALKSDGTVVAWGDNSAGQASVPAGLSGVTAIAAGGAHTVALTSDGTVVAWGFNGTGQTSVPAGLSGVTAIAAGGGHTVALLSARDTSAPTASPSQTPGANAAGWNNQAVTVSWNWTDPAGGDGIDPANCTTTSTSSGEGTLTLNATCTDLAGNTATASATVNVDTTAPTVTASPDRAPNASGWYNAPVTFTFSGTDTPGGSGSVTCDAASNYSGPDSATASVTGACSDAAGNTSSATASFKYDATAPTVSITAPTATSYTLNQVVVANYSCSDVGGSGVASCVGALANGANIDTASVGAKTFTINAADNAGNTSVTSVSYSVSYSVVYNFSGFFQPVDNLPTLNRVKAGSAVPVKFSLGGNFGLSIFAAGYPVSKSIVCGSSAPQERGRSMSYPTSAIVHAAAPVAQIAPHAVPIQANIARSAPDWQARAISSFQQAQCQALNALPELLATRVSALIGWSINPADVFVDLDAELATVVVDGVVFRAHSQQVVILRCCVECGITRFESAPLWSRADLGYALSAWQPHCRTCQREDEADSE